jgi:hypothetical protein
MQDVAIVHTVLLFTHARRCYYTPSDIVHTCKTLAVSDNFSIAHILRLLTGYDGYSTFIIPKVPTIFRGNAEDNSWYRGDS